MRLLLKDQFFKGRYEQVQKKIQNQNHKTINYRGAQLRAILKLLWVTKDPLGSPGKNLSPLCPPRSALKSTLFHTLAYFQQFQSLQTPQKFIPSQASILFTTSKSFNNFCGKMCSGKIFVSSVPIWNLHALHCMLNAQK